MPCQIPRMALCCQACHIQVMHRRLALSAVASWILLTALHGQQVKIQPREKKSAKKQPNTEPSPTLRVETNLVQVPVTVTDLFRESTIRKQAALVDRVRA